MTPEERAALKEKYPHHWFAKVIRNGVERIVAIPKRDEITPVPSLPFLDLDMLHGAVIRIGEKS